jgi:hypothetical protein
MRKTYKNKYKYLKTNNSLSKSRKINKRRRIGGGCGTLPLNPASFVGSRSNYIPLNKYHNDPHLLLQNGGKRRKINKSRKYRGRGGSSIIPSQLSYGVGNFYDKLFGYHHAVNPSPMSGQLQNTYFKPYRLY